MAIYKAKHESHYAQIPNATLRDDRLSFEARGVLAMILSLPDDWSINVAWICKQSPSAGRDKVTRILKELQDFGYMVKRFKQGEDGKMAGVDWDVHCLPVQLENRTPENPLSGKPDTTKKELYKERELKTLGSSGDKPAETPAKPKNEYTPEFEAIWKEKPNRAGSNPKKSAFKAYKARLKENATPEEMLAGLQRYKKHLEEQQKMNTPFVMRMATFLGPDEHFKEQWTFNTVSATPTRKMNEL